MIPSEDTIIIIQDELVGALAWADRHKLTLCWNPNLLELRVKLTQPETEQEFFLQGIFDGYRALPPTWSFCGEDWESKGLINYYPKPLQPANRSPIFIKHDKTPIICAPFNRLAYAKHQGPHRDWGEPLSWLNAGGNHVNAHFLGDMLQIIYRDFVITRGRLE